MDSQDPTTTDPALYATIFENDRVRVLEYRDQPGDTTHPHRHPDSVMYTLSGFQRRVSADGREVDVAFPAGTVRWLGAQQHVGTNTGDTATHVLFIELKEPAPVASPGSLGPDAA